jgi:hypothetical protein
VKILCTHPRQWEASAKAAGVEVRRVSIGGELPKRLDGSVSFDGIGEMATTKGIHALLEEAERFQPDIFLFGIHFQFSLEVLQLLQRKCPNVKLVMHYTDQRDTVPRQVSQYRGMIDLLLVTNKDPGEHARYKAFLNAPVYTFYDGVDLREYRPKAVVPDFDCYFGGNDFYALDGELMRRGSTQEEMLAKFPGSYYRQGFLGLVNDRFRLIIRGQWGWDRSKFNVKPMLFCPREVDGMLEAKIVLSTFNVMRQGLITRRMLRSLASGRMFLTQHCDGMEEHFENHKHLVWFHTPEEGLDLIRYYLEHESERERVGTAGRALVSKRHSFDCRLKDFVNIAREVFG